MVSGFEIRVTPDMDQTAFGIKDPVRGTRVPSKKAPKRSEVAALSRRILHAPLIQRVVQCMNGYWMFQCRTPFNMASGALVLCLSQRSLFDFNKRVKAGCRLFSVLGRGFPAKDMASNFT